MTPNITLEQWRTLISIVEAGGYAQAAEVMFKSQSAVTYAVQKIESVLGVKVFEIQGRKAMLTPTGQMLYRRALALVNEASELEQAAHALSAGWEANINIAAEILFPPQLLLSCVQKFGIESPCTRIELIESVIGGTAEALLKGEADIAISPQPPPGFLGSLLMRIKITAVAHTDHPLHHLGHSLTYKDLRAYRHLVVRDSSKTRGKSPAIVDVDQRWTVSQIATSIQAVSMGYGFAWLPEEHIKQELEAGLLKPLPLLEGGSREVPLYLVIANPDFAGPGIRRLAEIIKNSVA
ncbi:MAG: LysR family transcriptional regulator [Methylotenera sp.]|uniref:LysR family transcriptional regulator n=1 Tax=Methylotenera sp. TaxID=2051956 RepID=UPI0024891D6B|nr:LysR family transcriptional regulator [Methylotenera sp.]MDI1309715.1 LysR family transcriptional regulator [Methylotenera sp.]